MRRNDGRWEDLVAKSVAKLMKMSKKRKERRRRRRRRGERSDYASGWLE